jgi:hypothetical protein
MEDSLQGIREGEGEEGEEDEDSLPLQGARGGGDTVVTVDTVVKFEPTVVLKTVKSSVWGFFYFKGTKAKGPETLNVYCKLCKEGVKRKIVAYCGGTSNLKSHMMSWHKAEYDKAETEDKNPKIAKNPITDHFGTQAKKVYKWPKTSSKWKNLTMALAKWLCKDSRASYMVEDKGFIHFMSFACPEYDTPTSHTIGRYIRELYEMEKKKIIEKLKAVEFCSLTTDGGTSSNATSYQDTNVHYLDEELCLQSHCLEVRENKEAHTAENYRENTDEVSEEFGITKKIVMTVTDNENKMKAAFKKEERSGCMSHISHSSVTAGFTSCPEVMATLAKNRKIATKHNTSYAFKYKLEEEQKKMEIPVRPILQDVPTRWGSTRASTQSFLDNKEKSEEGVEESNRSDIFKDEFKNMQAINQALRKIKYRKKQKMSDYLLTEADMFRIKNLNGFLTKIDIFSTTLGGNKFVTASVVFPVVASMKKLLKPDSNDPVYLARMKEVILKDFKKRIAENLNGGFLFISTALDPRFKNLKMIEDKEGREGVFRKIEKEMREMSKEAPTETLVDDDQKIKKRNLCLDYDESDEETEDDVDTIEKEMTRYRNEAVLDKDDDPLTWWRVRKSQYPNLVRLVRFVVL